MTRRSGAPALLALALALGAVRPASAAPAVRRPTGVPPPAAASQLSFDIRFDDDVIERYLAFVERGDATAEELRLWVRLPGNLELLRQGRIEGGLTPDLLREAALVALRGNDFPGPGVLGSFPAWKPEDLRTLLDAVRRREPEMAAGAEAAIRPYLPAGVPLPPLNVRFHLGGSWDGRTTDAVYINLGLYKERGLENLSGLDTLLVHELFHRAQGALLPGVEDWSSRQSGLYTVLLRMQQEGMARHIEYGWLQARAAPGAIDTSHRILYADGLDRAPVHARMLGAIVAALDACDRDRARLLAEEGFRSGGPLYALGHAIAQEIEKRSGRAALAATVSAGPIAFLRAYETAVEGAPGATSGTKTSEEAPRAGSLLDAPLPARLRELEAGYGRDPLLASRTRRDGLRLMTESRIGEAMEALRAAVTMDPTDATSAYNLACAEALDGHRRKAMKWLRAAFDRGFDDTKHAAADDDLVSLRERGDFKELLREHAPAAKRTVPEGEAPPNPPDEPPAPGGR